MSDGGIQGVIHIYNCYIYSQRSFYAAVGSKGTRTIRRPPVAVGLPQDSTASSKSFAQYMPVIRRKFCKPKQNHLYIIRTHFFAARGMMSNASFGVVRNDFWSAGHLLWARTSNRNANAIQRIKCSGK